MLKNKPSIRSYASVVGKKESEGNLAKFFDEIEKDGYFGQKTFEQAESEMQKRCVKKALYKGNLKTEDINFMFGGDLLNQCISTTFGLKNLEIPLLGIYGACSTMSEGLLLAGLMIDNNVGENVVAVTSSHFCTAERQFRLPLDYGGQRTPTSQWTATASGACVVSKTGNAPYIEAVTVGKIVDLGIKDANNMGSAMAPAGADTIRRHLEGIGKEPSYYDCIITGDLGIVGSKLVKELLKKDGIDIEKVHRDCGVMMYDVNGQDVHAGGSGCGCSASVLCGYFLDKVRRGELKRILFCATGALLSPTSSFQGESIPSISHAVAISSE